MTINHEKEIEKEMNEIRRDLAEFLDETLEKIYDERTAFALVIYNNGVAQYISNVTVEYNIHGLKKLLSHLEHQGDHIVRGRLQ